MSNHPDPSQIWQVVENAKTLFTMTNVMIKQNNIGLGNYDELKKNRKLLTEKIGYDVYKITPLPSEFEVPVVRFPSSGFAPDYFSMFNFSFCSERLRDALAQPPAVIDYSPIDFHCAGAKAIAQNYQRMRVIAVQPGMDLERSLYDADPGHVTPQNQPIPRRIEKLVLRETFQPKTEIFYLAEPTLFLLAQDSLAARVLQAGCTGLEFQHLETPWMTSGRTYTVRTKRGIAQRG